MYSLELGSTCHLVTCHWKLGNLATRDLPYGNCSLDQLAHVPRQVMQRLYTLHPHYPFEEMKAFSCYLYPYQNCDWFGYCSHYNLSPPLLWIQQLGGLEIWKTTQDLIYLLGCLQALTPIFLLTKVATWSQRWVTKYNHDSLDLHQELLTLWLYSQMCRKDL